MKGEPQEPQYSHICSFCRLEPLEDSICMVIPLPHVTLSGNKISSGSCELLLSANASLSQIRILYQVPKKHSSCFLLITLIRLVRNLILFKHQILTFASDPRRSSGPRTLCREEQVQNKREQEQMPTWLIAFISLKWLFSNKHTVNSASIFCSAFSLGNCSLSWWGVCSLIRRRVSRFCIA